MTPSALASIDIGSTYTKGALFALEAGAFRLLSRAETPTTADNLAVGFGRVREKLGPGGRGPEDFPVYLSSSARGGLKIAALGLTADLTLSIARMAAYSAGGKIVRTYSYELAADEIAGLEALQPDIILFTGGTDGGNSAVVLRNAELLGRSSTAAFILYAGNAKVRDRVLALLDGKAAAATDNVMPEVGTIQIEPTREVIRKIFQAGSSTARLSAIVVPRRDRSRSLADAAGRLRPPSAGSNSVGLVDFGLVDMGGATTGSPTGSHRRIRSCFGLLEPLLKRTIEGDLGLPGSSPPPRGRSGGHAGLAAAADLTIEDFDAYIRVPLNQVAAEAAPGGRDEMMAAACVRAAAPSRRNAQPRFTAPGRHPFSGARITGDARLIRGPGDISRTKRTILTACAQPSRRRFFFRFPPRLTPMRGISLPCGELWGIIPTPPPRRPSADSVFKG